MVRLKVFAPERPKQTNQFQFHYGSIKGERKEGRKEGIINFNSTMVRLKGVLSVSFRLFFIFQFHYGSIKGC